MSSTPEHPLCDLTICVEGIEGKSPVMEAGRGAFPLCQQQEWVDLSERTSGFGRCLVLDQEWERVKDAFAKICGERQKRDT